MLSPELRHWWNLLEATPKSLTRVERWNDVTAPPARDDGGHLHTVPTLVICLAGVIRAVRPDRILDLHTGEGLVIAPGVWHDHAPVRRGSIFFAQGFLPLWSDVLIGDQQRSSAGRLPREPSRRLLGEILAAEPAAIRRERCIALIHQVLSETVADLAFTHPALQRMVYRLWSGLHRGVTVADIVRASGLSTAQAYRVFTTGYGLPPKSALEAARLELADGLIRSGCSPTETAQRCGFPSVETFRRARRRA